MKNWLLVVGLFVVNLMAFLALTASGEEIEPWLLRFLAALTAATIVGLVVVVLVRVDAFVESPKTRVALTAGTLFWLAIQLYTIFTGLGTRPKRPPPPNPVVREIEVKDDGTPIVVVSLEGLGKNHQLYREAIGGGEFSYGKLLIEQFGDGPDDSADWTFIKEDLIEVKQLIDSDMKPVNSEFVSSSDTYRVSGGAELVANCEWIRISFDLGVRHAFGGTGRWDYSRLIITEQQRCPFVDVYFPDDPSNAIVSWPEGDSTILTFRMHDYLAQDWDFVPGRSRLRITTRHRKGGGKRPPEVVEFAAHAENVWRAEATRMNGDTVFDLDVSYWARKSVGGGRYEYQLRRAAVAGAPLP